MFWNNEIDPGREPLKVLLKKGEFVDAARGGRVVPYKIYYPADHGHEKMPVIVWSHGFGGNRDGAGFISRFVVSHGYVIVHLTHKGSDSSLWEGKCLWRPILSSIWGILTNFRSFSTPGRVCSAYRSFGLWPYCPDPFSARDKLQEWS